MNDTQLLQSALSTKLAAGLSWLSAALGLGTFMGVVNTVIGIASAVYVLLMVWNHFAHTRPKNRLEMTLLRNKVANLPEKKD